MSGASANAGKLIHLTNQFWRAIVLENFTELENMLDCDCCVLNSFDDMLGTTTGIFVTLARLKELSADVQAGRLETAIQTTKVMRNNSQSRIYVHSKGLLSSPVGIAINWLEDQITGIIMVKNANESSFFVDDTLAPSSFSTSQQLSHPHSHTDTPGQSPPPQEDEDLLPPFLCPKPPSIPATLSVTVLSCSNLKSRMKRVITRSVDCYVTVTVDGQERRTEVVTDANPWFNVDNSFLFQLPDEFKNSGPEQAVARFRIMDKVTFGEDQELSTAALPLASLRGQVNNDSPSDITLPLILHNKVGVFGFEFPQNTVDDEVPLLKVRVSKVDVLEWWGREERRLRAEAREREAAEIALSKKHRIRHSAGASSGSGAGQLEEEVDVRPVMALASKSDWVDSKHVAICMGCLTSFTMTNRKHHCRSCGEVFCKKCSSRKVKLGSSHVRVCDRCRTTKRVSTAVLNLERDSVISLAERSSDEYSDGGDDEGFHH